MKKILFCLLITCSFVARSQVYNNEWINYANTYYKFKVGKTGVYRIPQATLASAGLGAQPAEYFQLWRNGVQVPIYTSVASGSMSSSDYIEFWGLMNDGKPDDELYRDPSYHLNSKWSLETDTAAYFLTVNSLVGFNLRLLSTPNDVASNTLPADQYFMYKTGNYFKKRLNSGYAVNVGEYLYSSSYDKGEGWASDEITSSYANGLPNFGKNVFVFDSLYAFPGGPAPKFLIATSGNAINTRRFLAQINRDSIISDNVDFFNYSVDSTNFSLSSLNSVKDTVTVWNQTVCATTTCPASDRMVVHRYEITYPRQFNFGRATSFEFTLPANGAGNFLQITNFQYGSATPVLYDLSNGARYDADMSAAPMLQFALQPSGIDRELVLVSEDVSQVNIVSSLQKRNFIDYSLPANQGDYLIVSNPALFVGPNGSNPVDDYKTYRSSAAGGSYKAKIYISDELIDQFGFGIKQNPAGLRDFIRYARHEFTIKPKHLFIIGRGVNYVSHLAIDNLVLPAPSSPDYATILEEKLTLPKLDLVPTFGWPASDVLLTAEEGSSLPELSVGRLSVVDGNEVAVYLKKMKEFELAQNTPSPYIRDKAWMKNVVHIIGASDAGLTDILTQYMQSYEKTVSDTLFGAKVETFTKNSSDAVADLNSTRLSNLFTEGITLITYFGHSSTTTLEFNLDNPENYGNFGKYPMFLGLGCNAGDFFKYSPVRLQTKETLSEKYVLSPDRGTIGFVASTHFGIVHYLDIWASRAYNNFSAKNYGKTMGEIMKATAEDVFNFTTQEDFYARCNTEQSELHGDPALRLNPHPKPDYVIEDPMVKVSPGFISVADTSFKIEAAFLNIGRSPDSSVILKIERQLPGGTIQVWRDTVRGIRYSDTMRVNIHIIPATDKGLNKITVTVDPDNKVNEIYENNNSVSKDVMIYEDEARPVYPYNYAIINKPTTKFVASTANPFADSKQYVMEIDTTEKFNSAFKVSKTMTTTGGIMEFDPGVTFVDSTVYYWRVAPVVATGAPSWNYSSFVYLANSETGFGQDHFYQHLKSYGDGITLDTTSRQWKFGQRYFNLFVREGSWQTSTSQEAGLSVAINGAAPIRNTCYFQSLVFNVFDPKTFDPMVNTTLDNNGDVGHGLYGSAANNCFVGRTWNFEYRWDSVSNRARALNFMQNVIPDGAYVVVRTFMLDPVAFPTYAGMIKYANDWKADEAINGPGQDLYHAFKNLGFSDVDSFNRPRQFALIYKKNDPSFTPKWIFSVATYDNVTVTADCGVPDTSGQIYSPVFGPVTAWKELKWNGASMEQTAGDNPRVDIIGVKNNGLTDTLVRNLNLSQRNYNISNIDATVYPYLKLRMNNADSTNLTPYQLKYWRLTGTLAPEGAIAPNVFLQMKDVLDVGEPLDFQIAFKNVSTTKFDSVKVTTIVTDRDNRQHVFVTKQRPLQVSPDTLHIRSYIDTKQFVGVNSLYVDINPDNDQPEQYHFNNFLYRNFTVRGDSLNPLLDVTFDNVHILNHDIVSSRPNILIKLKDEAKWFLLDDKSTMNIQVRYPDNSIHPYDFNGDTVQFIPAQQAPNKDNTATAVFKPYFPEDGEYELIITGKDMSGNSAGTMEYRVTFDVINKPMISNMLNYPNPFTTSTAFVFTLTGSQVPQNIKIQILTITGKVVREITKDELGPLHVGRNITEYKWDGTDQYGQKLANGVYLYRVVTNLNGKSLDKYSTKDDNTDKYFNKGYGKMYLMR